MQTPLNYEKEVKDMTTKLIAVMQYRGMKQRELAARSGASEATISQICNNKRSLRDVETMMRVSFALNIDIAYFMDTGNKYDMFHYLLEVKQKPSEVSYNVSVVPNISIKKPVAGNYIKFVKGVSGVSAFTFASGETAPDGFLELLPTNNGNLLGMMAVQINDDSMFPYLMKKDIAVVAPMDIDNLSLIRPEKIYAVNFQEADKDRIGTCFKRVAPFDGGYMLYHDNQSYIGKSYTSGTFRPIWGEVVCVFRVI